MSEYSALGRTVRTLQGTLDRIPVHPGSLITYTSDEVTAVCPVTSQPDWYTVSITICASRYGIESKSLKLFLNDLRNKGIFCEDLAAFIASEINLQIEPRWVKVTVKQKPRGGVTIEATVTVPSEEESDDDDD